MLFLLAGPATVMAIGKLDRRPSPQVQSAPADVVVPSTPRGAHIACPKASEGKVQAIPPQRQTPPLTTPGPRMDSASPSTPAAPNADHWKACPVAA